MTMSFNDLITPVSIEGKPMAKKSAKRAKKSKATPSPENAAAGFGDVDWPLNMLCTRAAVENSGEGPFCYSFRPENEHPSNPYFGGRLELKFGTAQEFKEGSIYSMMLNAV